LAPDGYLENTHEGNLSKQISHSLTSKNYALKKRDLAPRSNFNLVTALNKLHSLPRKYINKADLSLGFQGVKFIYRILKAQLTQATTLPLKQGKFISSSLISSLTTLEQR